MKSTSDVGLAIAAKIGFKGPIDAVAFEEALARSAAVDPGARCRRREAEAEGLIEKCPQEDESRGKPQDREGSAARTGMYEVNFGSFPRFDAGERDGDGW